MLQSKRYEQVTRDSVGHYWYERVNYFRLTLPEYCQLTQVS